MKISASLYSGQDRTLEELVSSLDAYRMDMFHLDCNNRPEVFDDIIRIRQISNTPIDLHIISEDPQPFIDRAVELGVEYVQVQLEDARKPFRFPENTATRFGIALVSETPPSYFLPFVDSCFFVLFMTTTPGKSGGVFNKTNFQRIREFGRLFPGKRIHVDGGVNGEVSFILRLLGVDSVVSGSFLVNNTMPGLALLELLHREVAGNFTVGDFMDGQHHIPVILEEEATFLKAVEEIERFGQGFVFYQNAAGELTGISSNADIRRAVLKHRESLHDLPADDYINRNPLTIQESAGITDLLRLIKRQSFPVNFLPVTDTNKRLSGFLTFNSLIKGES
jgi:pentose-5-phosphate-3-epimerase